MPRNIRKRRESSSSSSGEEEAATAAKDDEKQVDIKEKIEELKFLQKQREKNHGLDVYSLAIGDAAETAAKLAARRIENDPWKSKTGGLVDMREIREKRGNEIVRHMNSNFAKETNQRDEDAEMQKFIEQQLREIRGGSSKEGEGEGSNKTYKSPNDVIFDLSSHLLESGKKKGGDGFTEEILSGIPEVDLGIEERMRNIEETEKAKSTVAKQPQHSQHSHHHHHHHHSSSRKSDQFTSSVNFVQHKRFDETLINADKQRAQQMAAAAALNSAKHQSDEPVVGDAPKHELLQPRAATNKRKAVDNEGAKSSKPSRPHTSTAQPTERASDDYCLERFKKNMKFSRGSKIKIG